MGTTSELDLEFLARTDAAGFISKFLELNGFSDTDTPAIEELAFMSHDAITLSLVDEKGGHEGEGEHVERVFSVKKHDETLSFIRITGYYSSYNGTDWHYDWTLVYPEEVVVTVYNPR